jgi:peptide/nickel transport system ATP-binding protein
VSEPVVEVEGLVKHYPLPRERLFGPLSAVRAVDGVSLRIERGRSLGVVGESGCGKSTLARLVMALEPPTTGRVSLFGRDVAALSPAELRRLRRRFQMVFQDPFGSLDPHRRVLSIVAEPIDALEGRLDRAARRSRVVELLGSVGLREGDLGKYPHEFSGGQRQRIAIARAISVRPDLIVADEPASSLDVSVQAQVLNLLKDLQRDFGVTYMLISHDLAVVEYVCDEIAVMYLGRIVEQAPTEAILGRPAHPYTMALLEAAPRLEAGKRRRRSLPGAPQAAADAAGCAFAARCPRAEPRCRSEAPELREIARGRLAACHFAQT